MLLILFLFFIFSKSKIKNPLISFENTPSVLGLFTSSIYSTPTLSYLSYDKVSKVIPSVKPTPKSKNNKNKRSKNSEQKDDNTDEVIIPKVIILPTPTPNAENLNTKLTLVTNFSKSQSLTPTLDELTLKSIFEKQIIDTFGVEEVNKVFTNVKNISFTNINIIDSEATAVAVIEYTSEIKTFKCYFTLQEGEWYLYKTEEN